MWERKKALFIMGLFCAPALSAQEISEQVYDTSFTASPRVAGMARPKAFEASYNYVSAFEARTTSTKTFINEEEAEVNKLEEIRLRAQIPLLLKDRTNLILGIRYRYEEYNFTNSRALESGLFKTLENKHLNSLNSSLLLARSLSRNRFLIGRLGAELNGDYKNDEISLTRFLKYNVSAIYGWKKTALYSYGFGLYYNYDLGGPSLYPVILYNKTFNSKWGVEALLPVDLKVRYNCSEKSILYAGYELSGTSYQLVIDDNPSLSAIPTLELRKSDVRFNVRWEQEIYDFLWFSLSAGYNLNVRFDLVEQDRIVDENRLLRTEIGNSPYAQASIFLVPPRSMYEKRNYRNVQ